MMTPVTREDTAPAWDRRGLLIVGTLIAVHLAVTVTLAARLNVWVDEAFSLRTTGGTLGHAVRQAVEFELQPPLYFALLNVWRNLGDSVFVGRLLSVLCAGLTLVAAAALSRRLLPRVHPAWAVAALAFNPFLIWAATEIRLYALAALLSTLLLLFYVDGHVATDGSRRARHAFAVTALAALYTQYYLGFLLLAGAAGLIATRRWTALRSYVVAMAAVGLGFAPMLPLIPGQVDAHCLGAPAAASLPDAARLLLWRLHDYLLPVVWPPLQVWGMWIWRFATVPLACAILWKCLRRPTPIWLAVAATGGAVLACFLGLALWQPPELVGVRHTVSLFVPALFALLGGAAAVAGRYGVRACAAIVLLFCLTSLVHRYREPAKPGDWRRVARYLAENERPGQPIVVFLPDGALPLQLHYDGENPIVPVPSPEQCRSYDVRRYALDSPDDVAEAVASQSRDPESLWVVSCRPKTVFGVDFHFEHLETFVAGYDLVRQAEVRETTVRLLRRRPDTTVTSLDRQP